MAQSGFASRFNFRKQMSNRAIGPKYETIIKTREEIDAEEQELMNEMNMKQDDESDDEVDISKVKKATEFTVDDIT